MKNLTGKLMDMACLSNGKIHLEKIDLQEIIEKVEQTLTQDINEKAIQVNKDLQSTEIQGDRDLIESLLSNIMENAIRFLPAGGKIEVKSYSDAKELALSISDNGIGMEEAELQKITEPFYRVDQSRSRAYGGAGLGLALCKQICDLHHAQINISSRANIGTKIEIRFTTLLQHNDDSEI